MLAQVVVYATIYAQLRVGGLLGGHSGLMIAEGRGNALVLLARALK
jgi:di/tripeptidase